MKKLLAATLLVSCAANPPKPAEPPVAAPVAEKPAPPATPDADYRQQAPAPGAPVEFRAPVPKQLKLSNGLPVFLIERHEVPLVSVVLAVRSGADTEPRGKAGLASMALDLLDEGTPTRDAAAIARDFEDLAAHYRTQADADASGMGVTALASTLDKVLEIFADVALHPVFRDADVERVRVERLGAIAQSLDDPSAVGQHVLARVLFGDQHPWGFPAEGTVDSVKSISRKDLAAWHAAWFQPANAALFVVGDTDEAALMPLLEASFGGWKSSKAPKPLPRKPAEAGPRTIYVVDKADAPQSQIWIGEIGVSSTAEDVFPVRVMNSILGGSFNSRLNGNLRTEHAWSYGVFSFFDTHREAGPFVAAGGVVSDKTAESLGEFISELRKMKSGEVSDAELNDAKDHLVHAIPALFISDDATAVAYARAWAHGLPADYYATYQKRVLSVSKDDVAKAARERLHPDTMAVVVVGPRSAIEEKISAMKLGKVELRDANGEALKAAAAAAKAGKK
jgi:zinc protease